MPNGTFPKPVADIVAILTELFRHQSQSDIVELFESAHAYFEETDYDNWNGGTYSWALRLQVPIPIFASAEPRLSEIEKDITGKLKYLSRLYPNDHLDEVTITPVASGDLALGQRLVPSDIDVRRLWPDGQFRLFLSHASKHKVEVSALKDALKEKGISAFVAHEDIRPSREWLAEISLALRSMHALVALFTPDFHGSLWTDQEVGWALGRGVLVISVHLGADSYGFVGKDQWQNGSFENPMALAREITTTLLENPQSHGQMRRALVGAFVSSKHFAMAMSLRNLIVSVTDFSEEEKDKLRKACIENNQVFGAHRVREDIYATFGEPQTLEVEGVGDVIPSDDIPF